MKVPNPLRRIGWRIFIPFTVLLVSVALLFSLIGLRFAQRTILSNAQNELKILSIVLSKQVQRQLDRVEGGLTSMEAHPFLVQELRKPEPDRAALEDFLQKRVRMMPMFEDLAVFDRSGHCVGSTDPSWYGLDARAQPFFVNGLKNFNFSDIFTSEEGNIQLVSTRLTNGTVTRGVLVGQVNMSSIYDLMDQKLGLSETTDAFLLDSALRFITPGKTGNDQLLESHLLATPLIKHLRDDLWVGQYKNFNGEEVLGTVLKIPGRRWYVVVERNLDEVMRPILDAKKVIVVATLALVAVLIVVTYFLTRSITRPMVTLLDGVQRVAKGDLRTSFTIPQGIDELAFLASEFDKMRAKVAAFQERLIERLEESERRRIESERLAAIGTLASTLAHEIRNPLNAMSLLLTRLELARVGVAVGTGGSGGAAVDPRAGVIRDLRGEITRLDRLVSDILDYAKPLNLQERPTDLRSLVESTLELYRGLFEGRGIDVRLDFPETPLKVRVDVDRIKQCFVNLLQNAVEAVSDRAPGHGRIDISGRVVDGAAEVLVRDNGVGLPAQPEGRLFDLFFTTKETGTGLGLSTVRKILDAHRGQINLAPRADGPGTEVRVSLPLDSQS